MLALNDSSTYTPRLIQNLLDVPYTIFEHLLVENSILRPKQKEAINEVADKLFSSHKRAVAIIMPTGTGKTVINSQIIAGLKADEHSGRTPKKTVIVTDSREGIEQTREKLKRYADINAGAYYQEEKNVDKQVVITTYQSWQSPDFPIVPEDVDILILDEAHKSISEARLEKSAQHKNAIILALTASPTFNEEHSLLEHFEQGYRLTVKEAVHHGLISSFRNIVLNSNIDIDLDEFTSERGDFAKNALAKALNTEARNRIGSNYILFGKHFDTGQPVKDIHGIISCVNTQHAEDFSNQLNLLHQQFYPGTAPVHGFVRAISGKMKNRDQILRWHQEGLIGHLAFADLLNENYDDPAIGFCLNLRMTQSRVIATQRGGRAERLYFEDPHKIALIIDIMDKYNGTMKKAPLFYAHAIGESSIIKADDAKFAEERKKKIYNSREIADNADLEEFTKSLELNIVTNEETILSIFKTDDEPEQNDNYLSVSDIAILYDLSEPLISRTLTKLNNDWALHESEPEKYARPPIERYTFKGKNNKPTTFIAFEDVDKYALSYLGKNAVRKKTDKDATSVDIAKEAGVQFVTVLKNGLNPLIEEWKAYHESPETLTKPEIDCYLVKPKKGPATYAIPYSQVETFIKKYIPNSLLPEKTWEHMTVPEISVITERSKASVENTFKRIKNKKEILRTDNNADPIKLLEVKKSNGTVRSIHFDNMPIYLSHFYPDKLEYFLQNQEGIISMLKARHKGSNPKPE